jgi:hypothetical protein
MGKIDYGYSLDDREIVWRVYSCEVMGGSDAHV